MNQPIAEVNVKTFVFDFGAGNVEAYEKDLVPLLQSMEIGMLVNNVGRGYEYPDVLHRVDGGLKRLTDVDIINILPTTLVSHLYFLWKLLLN
ncbi:unnamed protein product [Toxocara canis]|uniref:Carbamoyl-phosphate synthase (glutamine-hydrolyzing) n=1 Tax=Toxocara canis TaxID=6265 RepID=A0A183U7K9_TOXCA|nr:unnamed protein product [Toxocara canis]